MIPRTIRETIQERSGTGKVIVLVGPRQVGKTTLIKTLLREKDHLFLNGDDPSVQSRLSQINTAQLEQLIAPHKTIFVDEVQLIPNIGRTLKLITDQFHDIQVYCSGSSGFSVSGLLNESLTGRKWEFRLFPISWEEFEGYKGHLKATQELPLRMIYGMYPEVLNNPGLERQVLHEIVNSYLYKDILAQSQIRKPQVLEKLVRALALQMGQEVNLRELAQLVGVDKNTVDRYLELLCQNFVVFKLPSFSRNHRNEIKFNQKICFYDNGIRNMIINNFNPPDSRQDTGALWENFLLSERLKQIAYKETFANMYFWRTAQQQEIDYIEEAYGAIRAFEFKWNTRRKYKTPGTFQKTYNQEARLITTANFNEFVKI